MKSSNKHLHFRPSSVRFFYNHKMLSVQFLFQAINTHLHNIQLALVHLSCKVTFIFWAMKQLNYSVLSLLLPSPFRTSFSFDAVFIFIKVVTVSCI